MQDNHIITMLEEKQISRLSRNETVVIESHIADCRKCLRAYQAARVSEELIRARASQAINVSPSFKTRVMAAIRERQLSPELPALVRMWKAAGALVSVMAAAVAIMVALTLFNYTPGTQMQTTELTAGQNIYSPEYVVFEEGDLADETIAYDQALGAMYDSEDDDGN